MIRMLVLWLALAPMAHGNGGDAITEPQANTSTASAVTAATPVPSTVIVSAPAAEAQANTLTARTEGVPPAVEAVSPEPAPAGPQTGHPLLHLDGGPTPADFQRRKGVKVEMDAGSEGNFARDFKLKNLAGETVTMKEAIAQGPAVIAFWASWCAPCHDLLPALSRLVGGISDENLAAGGPPVWLLALNVGESAPLVKDQIKEHFKDMSAEWVLDPSAGLADEYGVTGIPMYFVVGRNGRVLLRGEGSLERDGAEEALAALLKTKAAKK